MTQGIPVYSLLTFDTPAVDLLAADDTPALAAVPRDHSRGHERRFAPLLAGLAVMLLGMGLLTGLWATIGSDGAVPEPPPVSNADAGEPAQPAPVRVDPPPAAVAVMVPPKAPVPVAPPAAGVPMGTKVIQVIPGQTLSGLLGEAGVETADIQAVVEALKDLRESPLLQAGEEVRVRLGTIDGVVELQELVLASRDPRRISVMRQTDGTFSAHAEVLPVSRRTAAVRLTVNSTLSDAAAQAGLPAGVLAVLVRAYAHDVDFQRDLRRGDRLEVLYERYVADDGTPVRTGVPLLARLTVRGKVRILIRYAGAGDAAEYVSETGERVGRSALLRTPLDGARVSSGFGIRVHPVSGETRPHRGVDFAAPAGTPIYAAGDGVVEERGDKGGYGHYLRLRHDDAWTTAYGHLERFVRGIKPGARVRQGQIIGYVGSSGLSTGPHLHFELHRNGQMMDPRKVAMIRPAGLGASEQAAVRRQMKAWEADLATALSKGKAGNT